ncbi:hypothetical protein ACJMK2_008604 [Sinanodonta woodiana]|uniref:Transglutaminase-like domain-containing protein n=1 Tax=Sinanodonta woodiana TaxID=1069815 RepID=A0ABD3VMN6_SINWO
MGLFPHNQKRKRPPIPDLATYPLNKNYIFSEKYQLYSTNVEQLEGIMLPPQPPNRKKLEILDNALMLKVQKKASKVPNEQLSYATQDFVLHLVEGIRDDLCKLRVLFWWFVTLELEKMPELKSEPTSGTPLHLLWKMKTNQARNAYVFSKLCRHAGLPCVIVHGYLKGTKYEVGQKISEERHYGEWNAVLTNKQWRFVDTLWGACEDDDPETVDENYFLTDPQQMIVSHFAAEPKWQLLEKPKSLSEFQTMACLKSRFFDLGMQVLSHPLCEIIATEGEVDILFGLPHKKGNNQRFQCFISHFGKQHTRKALSQGRGNNVPIFIHRLTESSISIKVRFPEASTYKLEIVGKELGDPRLKDFDWVVVYKVLVEIPSPKTFPAPDVIGWGPGKEIIQVGLAPFNYTSGIIVAKNLQTKIRFKILDTAKMKNMSFYFRLVPSFSDNPNPKDTGVSDRFEIDLNIMTFYIDAPENGEYTLKMFAKNVSEENAPELNVCNYLLISDLPTPNGGMLPVVLEEGSEGLAVKSMKFDIRRHYETETTPLSRFTTVYEDVVDDDNVSRSVRSASDINLDQKSKSSGFTAKWADDDELEEISLDEKKGNPFQKGKGKKLQPALKTRPKVHSSPPLPNKPINVNVRSTDMMTDKKLDGKSIGLSRSNTTTWKSNHDKSLPRSNSMINGTAGGKSNPSRITSAKPGSKRGKSFYICSVLNV